ncbi:MAG: hypothetical protein WD029_07345, partial [Microthrixaceae bacterium]
LSDHESALNQLEVKEEQDSFSVDASTDLAGTDLAGTDLARTMAAAVLAAEGSRDMAHVFEGLCSGSSQAATGPAGNSLAAVFSGLAKVFCNLDHLDGPGLALGLEVAAELLASEEDGLYAGEMPAVVAAAAAAALSAVDEGAELAEVLITAADQGLQELETGPSLNPRLVQKGVVDAASAGFLLLLDSLASVVTHEPLPSPPADAPRVLAAGTKFVVRCEVLPHSGCGIESANWLESSWHELGTLNFFNGIGTIWKAELVTTLPGEAVESIFEVGRPQNLHIGVASESS